MRRRAAWPGLTACALGLATAAACAGGAPSTSTRDVRAARAAHDAREDGGNGVPASARDSGASADGASVASNSAGRSALLDVTPSGRAPRASLFGTDVLGLSTGATLTPDAAPGAKLYELDPHEDEAPAFRAMGAVATAISPDKKTLLVLTSGYNRLYDAKGRAIDSTAGEYVFVYDVSGAVSGASPMPRETQVVRVPNTFGGLAFHPKGDRFYVSGGPDDVVHEVMWAAGKWEERSAPIALGHRDKHGFGGVGVRMSPYAAGLALSTSGERLVIANHDNDSVTIVDTTTRSKVADVSLLPSGVGGVPHAGGEFPFGVAVVGEARAYVTSQRDRELVEVDLDRRVVLRRIAVGGQPTTVLANQAATRLYVANANSDSVSVVDRGLGRSLGEIATAAPAASTATDSAPGSNAALSAVRSLRGSNPNGVCLSPDERTLYVTNGGTSTLAVISLGDRDRGVEEKDATPSRTIGLVPTGYYPHAVSVSKDGSALYIAHGKSITRPNPRGPWLEPKRSREKPYAIAPGNEYSLQLLRGGLLAMPTPSGATLEKLTTQSLVNNRFHDDGLRVPAIFRALRGKVKHVVYVVGENRTYDQLLGDLAGADGDKSLVHWGEAITPNAHALARTFVTLDRFFDSGGVSGDGWQWTMGGRSTDVAEKEIPLEYAGRGHHSYDWEGTNRGINVGLGTLAARLAFNPITPMKPDLLPGTADFAAIDGPADGGRGFLWDVAIAAGLSVRNYGAFVDDSRYALSKKEGGAIPLVHMPDEVKLRVAYPARASLMDVTDPYFRGYDLRFADYWRYREWARELDLHVAKGDMPSLEIVRLPRDHLGAFATAEDGVDTPDTQMADHDYAIGLLVEKLSKSPFWSDTVVIVVEDDAQNGADHVDSHRSFALVAGGHVRRGAVVSTAYTTTSVLRTIELLLGLPPLGQQDAVARPMEDLFTEAIDITPFTAVVPAVLRSTTLPVPRGVAARPRGDREWWARETAGYDFTRVDAIPTAHFNRVLHCGLIDATGCVSTEPPVMAGVSRQGDGDDD
jgi:YVTN family beta-propeller protein